MYSQIFVQLKKNPLWLMFFCLRDWSSCWMLLVCFLRRMVGSKAQWHGDLIAKIFIFLLKLHSWNIVLSLSLSLSLKVRDFCLRTKLRLEIHNQGVEIGFLGTLNSFFFSLVLSKWNWKSNPDPRVEVYLQKGY